MPVTEYSYRIMPVSCFLRLLSIMTVCMISSGFLSSRPYHSSLVMFISGVALMIGIDSFFLEDDEYEYEIRARNEIIRVSVLLVVTCIALLCAIHFKYRAYSTLRTNNN